MLDWIYTGEITLRTDSKSQMDAIMRLIDTLPELHEGVYLSLKEETHKRPSYHKPPVRARKAPKVTQKGPPPGPPASPVPHLDH